MSMRYRLNNKGNTLAIVLIGIFILSILGTLILGVTSTNYHMKVVDQKTEKTLYYAEKAVDDLYAVIGTEIMKSATSAYKEVLENYIAADPTGSSYTIKNKDDAMEEFEYYYYRGKDGATPSAPRKFDGIKDLYYVDSPSVTGDEVDDILTRLELACAFNFPGYSVSLKKLANTRVEYEFDIVTGGAVREVKNEKCLKTVKLFDVCVECKSDDSGYYSSVTTDYTIKVPNIEMDFVSSDYGFDIDNLCSFAIVAEGEGTSAPAMNLNNRDLTVDGDLYAGTYVEVNNEEFTLNGSMFYCKGDFNINDDAIVKLGGKSGALVDSSDGLQFYANNINVNNDANVEINANCIVRDDLEIDGDGSNVTLSGNYFGYGFRGNKLTGNEDDTTHVSGFVGSTSAEYEHNLSSAIIINGKNANLNCLGLGKLILAGRAYIDLEVNGTNASYMTGESVSVKGNQRMYLAKDELNGTLFQGKNPITYDEFDDIMTDNYGADWESSEVDLSTIIPADNVIAKYIVALNQVYFYIKESNPNNQTANFRDRFLYNYTELDQRVKDLGVQNISFSTSLEHYTVGAITEVDSTNLKNNLRGTIYTQAEKEKFIKTLDDIARREDHLLPELRNINKEGVLLGTDFIVDNPSIGNATSFTDDSPYNYFINKLVTLGIKESNLIGSVISEDKAKELLGVANLSGKKIGFYIDTKNTGGNVQLGTGSTPNCGVVVTNKPVEVHADFEGLIITNKTIKLKQNTDITIKANDALVKYLFENVPELSGLLNSSGTGKAQADNVVTADSIKYTDLVKQSNWRKNFN